MQRKLTQANTAAIYATAGMNHAAQTNQMAMQQEQLRIAQLQAAMARSEVMERDWERGVDPTRQPGWRPDPLGTHELRWWGGVSWMAQVMDGGVQSTDPDFVEEAPAAPDAPAALEAGAQALPASTETAAGPPSLASQIRELGELRDAGLLTDDEFAAQKARLLA